MSVASSLLGHRNNLGHYLQNATAWKLDVQDIQWQYLASIANSYIASVRVENTEVAEHSLPYGMDDWSSDSQSLCDGHFANSPLF